MKIIDLDNNQPDYWQQVNMRKEDFVDRSFVVGQDIVLGFYTDKEKKKASFFHEIGHLLIENSGCQYQNEKNAWKIGLELANNLGITFSSQCHKWIKEQLEKYKQTL